MVVYRVAKRQYAHDLSGEGARLHGGRWNHPLTPCLYCSESRALALLEFAANVASLFTPPTLVMLSIEVPEQELMMLKREVLPANWNAIPAGEATKNMGTLILNESAIGVVGVPSCIVPDEWNYLLNPRVLAKGSSRILEEKDIDFDFRIKQ